MSNLRKLRNGSEVKNQQSYKTLDIPASKLTKSDKETQSKRDYLYQNLARLLKEKKQIDNGNDLHSIDTTLERKTQELLKIDKKTQQKYATIVKTDDLTMKNLINFDFEVDSKQPPDRSIVSYLSKTVTKGSKI